MEQPIDLALELQKGIDIRESGKIRMGIQHLTMVERMGKQRGEWDVAVRAMDAQVVGFQLLYDVEGDEGHLDSMLGKAKAGLVDAGSRADSLVHVPAFHFRLGVAQFLKRHYSEAELYFHLALKDTPKDSLQLPEFLSYHAISGIMRGKPAETELNRALDLLKSRKSEYRDWDYLIIKSGIYMRIAMSCHKHHDPRTMASTMKKVEKMAKDLKANHDKPLRMIQFKKLQKELMPEGIQKRR